MLLLPYVYFFQCNPKCSLTQNTLYVILACYNCPPLIVIHIEHMTFLKQNMTSSYRFEQYHVILLTLTIPPIHDYYIPFVERCTYIPATPIIKLLSNRNGVITMSGNGIYSPISAVNTLRRGIL